MRVSKGFWIWMEREGERVKQGEEKEARETKYQTRPNHQTLLTGRNRGSNTQDKPFHHHHYHHRELCRVIYHPLREPAPLNHTAICEREKDRSPLAAALKSHRRHYRQRRYCTYTSFTPARSCIPSLAFPSQKPS